jgi:hypothetical protein
MQRRLVATNIPQDSRHRLHATRGFRHLGAGPTCHGALVCRWAHLVIRRDKYKRGCEQSTNGSVERALGLGKIVQATRNM